MQKEHNLSKNQKIIFDIDHLENKITKIVVPINKKKDLTIFRNIYGVYDFNEITKILKLFEN